MLVNPDQFHRREVAAGVIATRIHRHNGFHWSWLAFNVPIADYLVVSSSIVERQRDDVIDDLRVRLQDKEKPS